LTHPDVFYWKWRGFRPSGTKEPAMWKIALLVVIEVAASLVTATPPLAVDPDLPVHSGSTPSSNWVQRTAKDEVAAAIEMTVASWSIQHHPS
jgi:hypothetical protein